MTTTPVAMCHRDEPHGAHFHAPDGGRGSLFTCPGIDAEPLAPERDRDQTTTPDWTPEHLFLSDAAAFVVRAYESGTNGKPSPSYYGGMAVWKELTGMNEPEALTFAYSIATAHPPITGVCPPF